MNVNVVGTIIIRDDFGRFYRLRAKSRGGVCPECSSPGFTTEVRDRQLLATCPNAGCRGNVRLRIPPVQTYWKAYELKKEHVLETTDALLKKKYDHMFDYSVKENVEAEKSAYVQAKEDLAEMTAVYQDLVAEPETADFKAVSRAMVAGLLKGKYETACTNYKVLTQMQETVRAKKYRPLERGRTLAERKLLLLEHLHYNLRDLELKNPNN
jgi:hypothetical protein